MLRTLLELNVRSRFSLGLLLTVLSGAAALAHQLLWTQRVTDLLGSSVESTTRVFGCFFLGLSVGAGLIALYVSRISRPWRAMAIAEFGVALLCLTVLGLSGWTDWIWPWIGSAGLVGWQGGLIKLGLSASVVFVPAFAMGTVFPLLAKGVVGRTDGGNSSAGWLYAANTAGGVLGLGFTAGYALDSLGVSGSLWLALGLNVAVGLLAFWADRSTVLASEREVSRGASSVGWPLVKALGWKMLLTAFLSGALVLALEILAMELVMLVAPLSFFAPVAVLASFILALAVSAGLVPVLGKFIGGTKSFLFGVLLVAGVGTVFAPIAFVRNAIESGGLQSSEGLAGFTLALSGLVLLSFGPGLLIGGTVFPSLLRMLPKGCDRSAAIGTLLAVNGFGGLMGAEWAFRVLVPRLGIYVGIGVIALTYVLAAGLWMGTFRKPVWTTRAALATGVALVGLVSVGSLRDLPVVNRNVGLKVLDLKMGREGNLAVVEHESFGRGLLFSNQYLLGSTNVRYDQERQAHIPLLLHPAPKQVCFLGLATGITPSAALQHSRVKSIEIVELTGMVVDAANEFFSNYNAGITQSSAARIVVEDGRTFIASQPNKYDVVIGDLFLPWRAGVGRLYSVEHFRAVKKSLRSGGLFCQWLPLYQFTAEQLELVMNTFQSVFPKTYLFEGKLELVAPVLAMLGYQGGELDWEQVEASCKLEREANLIKDPTVRHVEGLAMLFRSEANATFASPEINTLNNMVLELRAGLHRILDSSGKSYLVGENWLRRSEALLESASAQLGQSTYVSLSQYPHQGKQISRYREALSRAAADRNSVLKRVFALIPPPLRGDRDGDWKKWAGPEIAVRWRPRDEGSQGDGAEGEEQVRAIRN